MDKEEGEDASQVAGLRVLAQEGGKGGLFALSRTNTQVVCQPAPVVPATSLSYDRESEEVRRILYETVNIAPIPAFHRASGAHRPTRHEALARRAGRGAE